MKYVNQAWVPTLNGAIRTSIDRFSSENEENFLSDLYIYLDEESALHFYDDLERELFSVSLDKESDESAHFEKQLSHTLQQVLRKLGEERFFDRDFIFKPFAVSLIDKDFIVSEELIFIDDDTVKLNGELLAGLNDELNSFFRELMEK